MQVKQKEVDVKYENVLQAFAYSVREIKVNRQPERRVVKIRVSVQSEEM